MNWRRTPEPLNPKTLKPQNPFKFVKWAMWILHKYLMQELHILLRDFFPELGKEFCKLLWKSSEKFNLIWCKVFSRVTSVKARRQEGIRSAAVDPTKRASAIKRGMLSLYNLLRLRSVSLFSIYVINFGCVIVSWRSKKAILPTWLWNLSRKASKLATVCIY